MTWKGCLALIVSFAFGFMTATAIHELLQAMHRSHAKRSAADCRSISDAIEHYRLDHGQYPPLDGNVEHLRPYLVPRYLKGLPTRDMWNQPLLVVMNGPRVTVISIGHYGAAAEAGALIRDGGVSQ